MYVTVSPSGTVTFGYDYRLNGRRETLILGRREILVGNRVWAPLNRDYAAARKKKDA